MIAKTSKKISESGMHLCILIETDQPMSLDHWHMNRAIFPWLSLDDQSMQTKVYMALSGVEHLAFLTELEYGSHRTSSTISQEGEPENASTKRGHTWDEMFTNVSLTCFISLCSKKNISNDRKGKNNTESQANPRVHMWRLKGSFENQFNLPGSDFCFGWEMNWYPFILRPKYMD